LKPNAILWGDAVTVLLLTNDKLSVLMQLGDILIPGRANMPRFSVVAEIDRLLLVAARATSVTSGELVRAIDRLPQLTDLAEVKGYSEAAPQDFALLAALISGAYYMSREVMVALNYPLERRNPAGTSDFADEYLTGIVDPVIENNRGAA